MVYNSHYVADVVTHYNKCIQTYRGSVNLVCVCHTCDKSSVFHSVHICRDVDTCCCYSSGIIVLLYVYFIVVYTLHNW